MNMWSPEILNCLTRELQDLKMENEGMKGLLSGITKSFPDLVDRAAAESAEKNYLLRYSQNIKKIEEIKKALSKMEDSSFEFRISVR